MSFASRALRAVVAAALFFVAAVHAAEPVFESGQTRPLALSPDGSRLFAVDTPDARLEIFDVTATGLKPSGSVPVGLEPIAVAARSASEVWVVNQLSDSVSIVDVSTTPPRVKRTLLVGDEPGDVVFAGAGRRRAFVTCAHRGQNSRVPPDAFTPGVGRADVWVFDADNLGSGPGGVPITVVTLFGDAPRALAVSPDGGTVYAAVHRSGNRTTVVTEGQIPAGAMPPPRTNADGVPAPATSLIVKYDGAHWRDPAGQTWDGSVRFSLPDKDVFAIDANASPPREVGSWSGVGTVLFAMAVNPATGRLYVSNTEARNDVRFEGSGAFAGSTLRGHVVDNRVSVIDASGVRPRTLNPHIRYDVSPGPDLERQRSLAQPMGMAVTSDGATMYLAAFSSGKVAIVSTAALEAGTWAPRVGTAITIPGGGPSGIVLDETRSRLYVMSRFDDAVVAIRLADRATIARYPMNTPESSQVIAGRRMFYNALKSSGHSDASCASCHVFGHNDGLAWDLGNPDGSVTNNPNPFKPPKPTTQPTFHPMKGPMTTQTLRSMPGHGPLHWRGDRTGGSNAGGDPLDTRAGFMQFAPAFDSLLGRGFAMDKSAMGTLADFILRLTAPPNPVRNLDNTLTAAQARGRDLFQTLHVTGTGPCVNCHAIDASKSEFGADGNSSFDGLPQLFKIPTLRSAYEKVGMFGMAEEPLIDLGDNGFMGDQIRGFGFSADGSVDTLTRFLRAKVFNFPGGDAQRRDVAEFVMAFEADLAPIVGQQVTRSAATATAADPRIDLMIARAVVTSPRPECDLVVHGVVGGKPRGWLRLASGLFAADKAGESPWTDAALRALALVPGQELTYLAAPPGTGTRLGLDRDGDGYLDGDEWDAHSDAANALSTPLDRDADGHVNDADCAPDDAGAWAYPVEVTGLRIARDRATALTSLTWASQTLGGGMGTTYDLASGSLADLRADRGFARATCAASSVPDAPWSDPRPDPAPAAGSWYLVRAHNACGPGTYGAASPTAGPGRSIAACP